MEFGVFYQLPSAKGQSPAQRFDDTIAQAQLADQLGFNTVWLAELHFNPRFSIMPAPLLLGSAIARVTQRIKIGTAVNLLPLHNPIRLAEETATLDILSHGRAIFGIGRGAIASHFEGYGVPLSESRQRFEETLEIVLKAWTTEEFSYQGQYYQFQDLRVVPKPYQQPYPPIYVAANSPDTFDIVGLMGHHLLVAPLIISNERAQAGLEVYRQHLSEGGHDLASAKVTVTLPVYVAEDRKKARAGPEASISNYLSTLRDMYLSAAAERAMNVYPRMRQGRERMTNLSYDQIYDEFAVIGDPDQCVTKLKSFQKMFGPQEFMCWFNTGGLLPHQEVEKSMRLFAEEVMPHFK
jgi:natural product biosynthesis luciferase-like monooxygenase protein